MPDILALLQCLRPSIGATSVRQLSRIVTAILAMTGRVTMLGISRWAGKGGSYRTVQRFFHTALPWATLFWVFFRQHLFCCNEVYLLAGDEVVVTKAGKKTYGLERFFSSLYGKPLFGLSFFALSLVSIQQRRSFPIRFEQILKTASENLAGSSEKLSGSGRKKKNSKKGRTSAKKSPKAEKGEVVQIKNRGGRPKGSKNKDKTAVTFTSELLRIQGWIQAVLQQVQGFVPLTYLLLDGHFGNNNALQMARQLNLHLISKLRCDSALYLPYENPKPAETQSRRKYGEQLNFSHIPDQYLKESTEEDNIKTEIYQAELLHKEFAQALNVVILVKAHQITGERRHIILFSSDLGLSDERVIDYYSLRFQIEFNFRDAKQFWGLEDFMNVSQTAVTNAANLSLFMVNLSHHLLGHGHQKHLGESVLDLKTTIRAYKYMDEIIKLLPEKPEPVLLAQVFQRISSLGRIHRRETCTNPN